MYIYCRHRRAIIIMCIQYRHPYNIYIIIIVAAALWRWHFSVPTYLGVEIFVCARGRDAFNTNRSDGGRSFRVRVRWFYNDNMRAICIHVQCRVHKGPTGRDRPAATGIDGRNKNLYIIMNNKTTLLILRCCCSK